MLLTDRIRVACKMLLTDRMSAEKRAVIHDRGGQTDKQTNKQTVPLYIKYSN